MTSEFLDRLKDGLRRIALNASDVLFRRGEKARAMFVLEAGQVRLVRSGPDGHEITLHSVRPGESFAEPSCFPLCTTAIVSAPRIA